ncbi:hypothetical protein FQR65_LT15310 [Abscondita terminalis]|nr:hypothetical protein FQR65_LT15310 [Abscondita terminalis]
MAMYSSLIVFILVSCGVAQILHPGIQFVDNSNIHISTSLDSYQNAGEGLAHPAVVENSLREMQLHPHLLNPFYKDPVIASNLAKQSLIQNQEFPVFNREAEKIPRTEVLKIFQRAKFFQRRRKMNRYSQFFFLAILYAGCLGATTTPTPTPLPTAASQPIYHHQDAIPNFIPRDTYPYPDAYNPNPGYDGYLIPVNSAPSTYTPQIENKSLGFSARGALNVMLKVLAKVGLFLLGGVALLVVGGVFTTAVCSLSPICTIEFHGLKNLNKETVRSLITPERVANAANFVEKAVDKYQRMQRAIDDFSG